MKRIAHRYRSHKAPLVPIAEAEAGHTYFSPGLLREMKAVLNGRKTRHYAFIGKGYEREVGVETVGSGGKGLVHDLYQTELAIMDRLRFWLYGRSFSLQILRCEMECAIYIGREDRRRIVCDNLLWVDGESPYFDKRNILNIEICDTHSVPPEKRALLWKAGVPTVEVETRGHVANGAEINSAGVEHWREVARQHLQSLGRVEPVCVPFHVRSGSDKERH